MAVDPICKMNVNETITKNVTEYRGIRYFFCTPGCKAAFDAQPEKYLKKKNEKSFGCCAL